MPDFFEIYDCIEDTTIVSYLRCYYRKGKYFYLKRGDCINHVWYSVRRISGEEFENAYQEYRGY